MYCNFEANYGSVHCSPTSFPGPFQKALGTRLPVDKSRYKGPNNTQQLTNDLKTKKEQWLFPCEPVPGQNPNCHFNSNLSKWIRAADHSTL